MSEVYVELALKAPADDALRELISFQLYGLGFSGFLETDNAFVCYIPKALWDDALQNKILSIVAGRRPFPDFNLQHHRNSKSKLEPAMGRIHSTR